MQLAHFDEGVARLLLKMQWSEAHYKKYRNHSWSKWFASFMECENYLQLWASKEAFLQNCCRIDFLVFVSCLLKVSESVLSRPQTSDPIMT